MDDLAAVLVKAAFDEGKHPRDDRGRFVPHERIAAAAADPKEAAKLRAQVTNKAERAKLDAAIAGHAKPAAAAPPASAGAHPPAGTVREPLKATDVPRHVREQGAAVAARATPEDRAALDAYTAEAPDSPVNYRRLNAAARDCPDTLDCLTPEQRGALARLDALARSNPLSEPVMAYRGIQVGSQRDEFLARAQAAADSGGLLQLHGVGSSSLDPQVGGGFGAGSVVFEIRAKTGAYVDAVSKVAGEKEFLLPHNGRYRVVGVQRGQRFRGADTAAVVQLEEV
jgi:hypothetical protein